MHLHQLLEVVRRGGGEEASFLVTGQYFSISLALQQVMQVTQTESCHVATRPSRHQPNR